MISSPEINKALRTKFSPILRENGFSIAQARKAWGWHDHCIWVLNIRAVGSHFSQVTGWPPMSVCVWTGVYYDFIPEGHPYVKVDNKGRLRPDEAVCHIRSHLEPSLNQKRYKAQLSNSAERKRNDIWWITPNGDNVDEVVEDIAQGFITQGSSWFKFYTYLEKAFAEIENTPDCYVKFYQLTHFAQHLGYDNKHRKYLDLLEQERKRIKSLRP